MRNVIVLLEVCGGVIMVEDDFFFNSGLFFSDVCERSFQNLTIMLGIEGSFLSMASG